MTLVADKEMTLDGYIQKSADHDCWLWTGWTEKNGYGRKTINYQHISAHRWSWQLHNGKIPDGKVILHKCDVKKCVNPAHLEVGSQKDNIQDSIRKGRHSTVNQPLRSICKNGGHQMLGENVYLMSDGTRECRACRNRRGLAYYYRKAAKRKSNGL